MISINSSKKIGIIGLGLIGGSLALDLKRLGHKIFGVTKDEISAEKARKRQLAQVISADLKIIKDCSIVIIALPLEMLLNPSEELISSLPPEAVITDVGSVKVKVLEKWNKIHPLFVGSHPMAGNNDNGIDAGQNELFKSKYWISTPDQLTNSRALNTIQSLAESIGSKWITSDPKSHDQTVALISHLPIYVSSSLIDSVIKSSSESILSLSKKLASSGFLDTSRVGGGNTDLGISIAKYNKKEILLAIKSFKESMTRMESLIQEGNWSDLTKLLIDSKEGRKAFEK
tara:strand:- start:1725 stop:2585 length:861 start_codon:yes stop_codon:yes gene_type:complete